MKEDFEDVRKALVLCGAEMDGPTVRVSHLARFALTLIDVLGYPEQNNRKLIEDTWEGTKR